MQQRLTSNEKFLLFILALVGTLVICIQWILLPTLGKYEALKAELANKQQERITVEQTLARAYTIDQEIEEVVTKTEKAIQPFFPATQVQYLHKWIVDRSSQAGIQLTNVSLGDSVVTNIVPYTVELPIISYPIQNYYNNMVNSTLPDEHQGEGEQPSNAIAEDAVLNYNININVKGSKANILKFIDQLEALNKYVVVQNFAFGEFQEAGEIETSINIVLYSIHKEDDGAFNYQF
ncbi:MAG: hypothetical protein H9893_04290 [Candidatus Niameybacter stercoravium]|nr:hypothetical protein [Candidatus Niameybacter stercoravium]